MKEELTCGASTAQRPVFVFCFSDIISVFSTWFRWHGVFIQVFTVYIMNIRKLKEFSEGAVYASEMRIGSAYMVVSDRVEM